MANTMIALPTKKPIYTISGTYRAIRKKVTATLVMASLSRAMKPFFWHSYRLVTVNQMPSTRKAILTNCGNSSAGRLATLPVVTISGLSIWVGISWNNAIQKATNNTAATVLKLIFRSMSPALPQSCGTVLLTLAAIASRSARNL